MVENNQNEYDYSNIILLKQCDSKTRKRFTYYIMKGLVDKVKTPNGVGIYKGQIIKVVTDMDRKHGGSKNLEGYRIDLSTPSKMNCMYKRLNTFTASNISAIKSLDIPRYVDEHNFVCINLKDFLRPQIKMIAKKLQCKEHLVWASLMDLLYSLYLHDRKKRRESEDDDIE